MTTLATAATAAPPSAKPRGVVSATRALLSPEAQFLVLTAGGSGNEAPLRRLLDSPLDWLKLRSLSQQERATLIVWQWLQRLGTGRMPADVANEWRRLAMVCEFESHRLEQCLHEAVDALVTRGIEVMLLKGSALAQTAYASFAERPMGDLDIMVRAERAHEAWSVLQTRGWTWPSARWPAEGYPGHQHLPPLLDTRGEGLRLEVHTDLLPAGHPFQLPSEALWRDAQTVRLHQQTARAPDPMRQLLHGSIHFAWTHELRWGGWRAFRDVAILTSGAHFPWEPFVTLARDSHATTACYWALRLARSLAGVSVPPGVLRALRPHRPELLTRLLEYHYALQLFPSEGGCPSVRLGRRLWALGMAPRWSGHGSIRPWQFDPLRTPAAGAGSHAWPRRLLHRVRKTAATIAYLQRVTARSPNAVERQPRDEEHQCAGEEGSR